MNPNEIESRIRTRATARRLSSAWSRTSKPGEAARAIHFARIGSALFTRHRNYWQPDLGAAVRGGAAASWAAAAAAATMVIATAAAAITRARCARCGTPRARDAVPRPQRPQCSLKQCDTPAATSLQQGPISHPIYAPCRATWDFVARRRGRGGRPRPRPSAAFALGSPRRGSPTASALPSSSRGPRPA